MPYSPGPPNMRSPPAYMGYPHPQATGPLPPYAAHQYQHWYPYQQMQPPLPPPPPQRHYHAYNAPMIVSSYPHTQPILAPTHILPPSVPLPPSTATPPALRSAFSPPPPQQMPNIPDNTPDIPPSNVSTVTERVKPVPIAPREAFSPPVSKYSYFEASCAGRKLVFNHVSDDYSTPSCPGSLYLMRLSPKDLLDGEERHECLKHPRYRLSSRPKKVN